MLSSGGRRLRLTVTGLTLVALVAGTFWGQDDHFPFGPFRMYSVTNRLDGEIRATGIEVTTQAGEEVDLSYDDFGLRRAELEGQVVRFDDLAALLVHVAAAYERRNPGAEEIVEWRLTETVHFLREGRTFRTEERTVAAWRPS